jgi:hypothetical protein
VDDDITVLLFRKMVHDEGLEPSTTIGVPCRG